MNPDPLMRSLLRERYAENRWWTHQRPPEPGSTWDDSDINTARRRRELLAAADSFDAKEKSA